MVSKGTVQVELAWLEKLHGVLSGTFYESLDALDAVREARETIEAMILKAKEEKSE